MTVPNMSDPKPEKCQSSHCKGKKNLAEAPHPCPYSEEIHDDSTTLCTCCKDCQRECAYDV